MPEEIVDRKAGRVRCEHRRAAIIGAGDRRNYAPWEEDSFCFWAINEIFQPRFARHFELHPMAVQNSRELAWLRTCPTPCYVLDLAGAEGRVANAVEYPLDWVLEKTGGRRYFTCTFAFQVALAIAEGFEEIGLWGVDLDLGTPRERLVEKPCVEYWLGLAEGRGITVTLPPGGTLLSRPYLYGYDYADEKAGIEAVCEEIILAQSRAGLARSLPRVGRQYGGAVERALAAASAELGRVLTCSDPLPPQLRVR